MTPLRPNGRAESEDRPRPYKPEVEQALLGALMISNHIYGRIAEIVGPDHFGDALHGRVFAAIRNQRNKGLPATPDTLQGYLAQDETLRGLDPKKYLMGLRKAANIIVESPEDYARAVREDADKREFIDAYEFGVEEIYRGVRSPGEIGDEVAKRLPHANGAVASTSLEVHDAADIEPAKIPPRGWLLGTTFCRKFISGLIAEGGAGKTAVRYAQYLALATGRRNITDEHVHHRGRVLLVCLEDDVDEVRRRISAAMLHHGVTPAELRGYLHYCTPQGLKLLQAGETGRVVGELYAELKTAIDMSKIDLVGIDPFVKAHGVEENDNNAIDQVCGMLAGLAAEFNCAIDLVSHARKGAATPGDAERDRGASAKRDAGRLMRTLTAMSSDEAATYGLNDQDRRSLVRVDDAKINLTAKNAAATWFRLVGVKLGNRSELYPSGDEVHTAERWVPPDAFADVSTDTWCAIIDEIDAGTPNGRRYTNANNATDRAAWKVVVKHLDRTEKQARSIVNTWVKTQVFTLEDYHDPVESKTLKGLKANPTKRPGNERRC